MKLINNNNYNINKLIKYFTGIMNKNDVRILKIVILFIAIFMVHTAMAQVGMRNFTGNMNGSSGGSGGGAGVPIDGGLVAAIAGSAGYAYKKLKQKN